MNRKRFRYRLEYILMTGLINLFRLLPYSLSGKMLCFLFVSVGMTVGIRKKTALQQLRQVFPDKSSQELKAILRNTYRNYALMAADLFLSKSDSNKTIEIEGWENITGALSAGNGLLLVSGHLGNWELAGRYITAQGIPISVIIKKLHNRLVNDYINTIRNRNNIKIIYKKKALRAVLTAFKNNEALVVLIDQNAGKAGVKLPFLGKDASLFTGFVRLAFKYDTPLVFGAALRESNGSFRFVFEKPVIPSSYTASGNKEQAELEIARHFHQRLEEYVGIYPEQWFWLHNRWKGADKAKQVVDLEPHP